MSTSSWGRELKCFFHHFPRIVLWSTSSWGRELKYNIRIFWHILESRPLREVVSWNICCESEYVLINVDLFVRSWVEMETARGAFSDMKSTSSWGRELKWNDGRKKCDCRKSTSSWGRELKYMMDHIFPIYAMSTSSWGRELKSYSRWQSGSYSIVDLFVRSWVEMPWFIILLKNGYSRPLREVVSWNVKYYQISSHIRGRPLREVVSWNQRRNIRFRWRNGRPLREVVSWNLWIPSDIRSGFIVDLFVRSWVEIFRVYILYNYV